MTSKELASKQETNKPFGLADIRALAKLVSQFDLTELELERDGERIRLRRELVGSRPASTAMYAPPTVEFAPPTPALSVSPAADDGSVVITSPFVGTFYRAPSPESAPFVEVGQQVQKGQVLCIVEAMKLMNEIEAETSCKIVEILVKNAEPVEFGQALFKVLPQT
jgi:acetyl-CoA carboxylase biotin carboxyl carrier protein